MEANSWWGFAGPAGLPAPIIRRLNVEVRSALADPSVAEMLGRFGIEANAGTPEDFATLIRSEGERWRGVARSIGLGDT